jgi:carboxymethylenebutenolidase
MKRPYAFVLAPLVLTLTFATAGCQTSGGPESVIICSGSATLHAMIWRPQGRGPFPAILLNHGSGRTSEELQRLGPFEHNADTLGPIFARHGYVLLYLYRRGVGPSTDQGANAVDQMNREFAAHGENARNALQLELLGGREMTDARAALAFLRARPYVDADDVALVGHSFGGSLTLLMAESEPSLRAVVVFSAAGLSFDRSSELRTRLLAAIDHVAAPVFFIHAENDYSLSSGKQLDARRELNRKPHRLMIYPPIGNTADEGHDFLHLGVNIWEPDVFSFLGENMRR